VTFTHLKKKKKNNEQMTKVPLEQCAAWLMKLLKTTPQAFFFYSFYIISNNFTSLFLFWTMNTDIFDNRKCGLHLTYT